MLKNTNTKLTIDGGETKAWWLMLVAAAVCCAGWLATPALASTTIHVPGDQPTIQQAINAASNGDEIVVAPSVYNEAINFNGKAVHLRSAEGAEVTTIDASGLDASVVTCESGEGPGTILEGFTITGGIGTLVDAFRLGGGMYNVGSSPTIIGCVFESNSAVNQGAGGGMYNTDGSSPMLTDCVFQGNSATNVGGGMLNFGSSPTLTNCSFEGNSADLGGGMLNFGSSPTLTDCVFQGNPAGFSGGGMYNTDSSPTLTGCAFIGNSAMNFGGGMHNVDSSSPTLTECDFEGNSAGDDGGGMWGSSDSAAQVEATLFCENTPNNIVGPWDDLGDNEFLDECPPDCAPADLNCDGVVDSEDLFILLAAWGKCADCANCPADLNDDCGVDAEDLFILLANWG